MSKQAQAIESFPERGEYYEDATIVAENAASVTTSPVTFANIAFPVVPSWRSGHIVASYELANDSAFPLEQVLGKMFAKRFARGCGEQFITNLLADADVAVTPDECFDLLVAVDATLRPAAWWWTAPERIRLEYGDRLCPTEQREVLLEAKLLDVATAKLPRERIARSRAIGAPVDAFDLHERRPEFPL